MKHLIYFVLVTLFFVGNCCFASDNPIDAVFKELEPGKMPVITVTNQGDADIDDITTGISLIDQDGNTLFSTGYQDSLTGNVWLAAGESKDLTLYITQSAQERNPAGKQQLLDQPDTVGVVFNIQSITYMEPSDN